ncbi:MAG TPA: acetylxylan esterase [Lacipirellula sp.]
MRELLLTIAIAACIASAVRAEIQTLYRGDCLTEAEAGAKLDRFAARYDSKEQWKAHANRIRRGILRGMKLEQRPPACPMNPIRHSVRQGDGYTVENVAFESLPGYWVTGNLYLPADADGPLPGVLCPHGHTPDKRFDESTQARCQALALMGAAVLAWDMVGYGESHPVPHRHSETLRLQTHNSLRAVDFLLSLGNVDEKRLGVTGESGGGTQTFLVAALDPRIDVSVPVVMVSAHFYGGCICESGMPIHKNGDHETDNVEIAAVVAPKPLLLVSCGGDWTKNTPQVEFPHIQRVYGLFGAKEKVENAHFPDEGHDYGPSKRKAMYPFMAKHLRLDLSRIRNQSGEIAEDFVKVRPREELLVFPPDRPRPKHAIDDAEAVFAELDRRGEK